MDLFSSLRRFQPSEGRDPLEDYLTEAWRWLLERHPGMSLAFLRLLGVTEGDLGAVRWQTQVSLESGRCRLDLVGDVPNGPVILCEHKVGSPLSPNQLDRYRAAAGERWSGRAQVVVLLTARRWQQTQRSDRALLWSEVHALAIEAEGDLPNEFAAFLSAHHLGPRTPATVEGLQAWSVARGLPEALKHLFAEVGGRLPSLPSAARLAPILGTELKTWQLTALDERWGRLGFDLPSAWRPGLFVGVLLDPEDHAAPWSDPAKGPDLTLVLTFSLEAGTPDRDAFVHSPEFGALRARLAEGTTYRVVDHLVPRKASTNQWHPLHLQLPLVDVLAEAEPARQPGAVLSAIDGLLAFLLKGGELAALMDRLRGPAKAAAKPDPATSEGNPIRVDWLPDIGPGAVGLTFAPGKRSRSTQGFRWNRDLAADLDHLVREHRATDLVCLLEDAREMTGIGIPSLLSAAEERGLAIHHFPIPDASVPVDRFALDVLLDAMEEGVRAGRRFVVHCHGGLGRTGTIAGCFLRRRGLSGDEALAILRRTRGDRCPENNAQKEFIRSFEPPSRWLAKRFPPPAGGERVDVRALLAAVEAEVARDPRSCLVSGLEGPRLVALGKSWAAGTFSTPSIAELRERVRGSGAPFDLTLLRGAGIATDIGRLQATSIPGTLFQVASQFNCLESPGPHLAPVAAYPSDPTQGPRASVSAFPGTFWRHYASPGGDGPFVQTADRQLDLLADALAGTGASVKAGYLLPESIAAPDAVAAHLVEHFGSIRIGVQDGVEVVLGGDWAEAVAPPAPRIAQAFTSTLALAYGRGDAGYDGVCRQLLRAAYLGTLLAALELGKERVVLTLIGGGAFGNPASEIWGAIAWAVAEAEAVAPAPLEVIVNARASVPEGTAAAMLLRRLRIVQAGS